MNLPRLHPWTRDAGSIAMILRRRGLPKTPERNLWDRVLLVAIELDDLAADLPAAPQHVARLAATVRDLLARLPESTVQPRMVPLVLLDAMDEDASDVESRAALADWLGEAAVTLARLAGAPIASNADSLASEATDVLSGLAPLLAAWTQRLGDAGTGVAPVTYLPLPIVRDLAGLARNELNRRHGDDQARSHELGRDRGAGRDN